jgi:mono/diheme cytochrome c family protein
MQRNMLIMGLLAASSLWAAPDGKALFEQNCAACHITRQPQTQEERMALKAPPAAGVMWHIKEAFPNKEKAIAFAVSYAKHPDADKAICPSIRRFGVMPDVAGGLSDKELEAIVTYWYDHFPPASYQHPKGMGRGMGRGGMMGQAR